MILNTNRKEQLQKTDSFPHILCFHRNSTPYLQMVKLMGSKNHQLERVLFPQDRLMFTAVPEAQLEIITCQNGLASMPERISCAHLQVHSSESPVYRESLAS